ncbi:MAG: hypothetical protein H6Q89_336 [Myxococcaceae bacterium]|nr:hypothetical protein [Myxococcaceae bacterium]
MNFPRPPAVERVMRTLFLAVLFAAGLSFTAPPAPTLDPDPTLQAAGGTDGGKKKKDEEKEEDFAYFLNRSAFSTTSPPAATRTVTFLFTPS